MAKELLILLGEYPKIQENIIVREFNQELYRTTQTLANIIWKNERYYLSISSIYKTRVGMAKSVAISLLNNYYYKINGQEELLIQFINNLQDFFGDPANKQENSCDPNIYDPQNTIMQALIKKTIKQ
jgi:hypothetical protein